MKLEIEYRELANCIHVLDKLTLKGLKSIHRTRLSKDLTEILQRAGEEQLEIQKEYFELDEEGNPIVDDEHCKDREEYLKTMSDFTSEKAVIDSGDSQVTLESVKKSMEDSEESWEGQEAYAFEYLYTALENGDSKGKDKEDTGE